MITQGNSRSGRSEVIRPEDNGRPQSKRFDTVGRREQAPLFDLRIERMDSLTHVELLGELDLSCEDRFEAAVGTVQSGRLVLDLRGLTFIDSTGLRMILRTWQRTKRDGLSLEIVRGRDQVEKVFRITGVDVQLPLIDHFPNQTIPRSLGVANVPDPRPTATAIHSKENI